MKWGVRRTPEQLGHRKNPMLKSLIKAGIISAKVNVEKQNRHILGHKSHTADRSYIYGTIEDAQKIVDRFGGTGSFIFAKNGQWTQKERIVCDKPIGVHVNKRTGEQTETNAALVIYSKTGTHVVPRKEDEK